MKCKFYLVLCFTLVYVYCYSQSKQGQFSKDKILIVLSNQTEYGTSDIPTANHFEETVVPYDEFTNAGFTVEFVSPEGGEVPLGYINTSFPMISKYIFDCSFMERIKNTKRPEEINSANYCAIFFSGGGAAMFGVPENGPIQKLAAEIYERKKGVVSAICHGTAGLVNIKTSDNKYLVAGKRVNGFPDAFENTTAAYYQQFPFSIQHKMEERGATFSFSEKGWDGFVIADDRLITGQDPSSARKLAKAIVQRLQQLK